MGIRLQAMEPRVTQSMAVQITTADALKCALMMDQGCFTVVAWRIILWIQVVNHAPLSIIASQITAAARKCVYSVGLDLQLVLVTQITR